MGSHPINLGFRFLLEVAAYIALGYWGWTRAEGWLRIVLAIGIPLLAAILWGTLAVPNDPSRSGRAPILVPGPVRLALELIFFGLAAWTLYNTGFTGLSLTFGALVVIHYLISYDRIQWLFQH